MFIANNRSNDAEDELYVSPVIQSNLDQLGQYSSQSIIMIMIKRNDFGRDHLNTFAVSYLNTQGLNNSCLKSRQRRPYSI